MCYTACRGELIGRARTQLRELKFLEQSGYTNRKGQPWQAASEFPASKGAVSDQILHAN